MSKIRSTCLSCLMRCFADKIQILHDCVQTRQHERPRFFLVLKTIFIIKSLSKTALREFYCNWYESACQLDRGGHCESVLAEAVDLKNKLVITHARLITGPSLLSRWAGKRLIGPVLDWNDLVLDLSIASDEDIQEALLKLEEVI